MQRLIPALVILTALGAGMTGCGDDDDDGGNDTGSKSNTAGTPGATDGGEPSSTDGGAGSATPGTEGGAGSMTPGTGGAPSLNLECTPSEDTTCQNDTDCSFVLDGTARTTAQTCGKGCIGGEETCARDCILEELSMTSDCAACYADFVNCTIANCVGACLADPDSDGCHTCQEEKGCRPDFNTCSGLPE